MTITEVYATCQRSEHDQEAISCQVFVNGRLHAFTDGRLPIEESLGEYQVRLSREWAEEMGNMPTPPPWHQILRDRKLALRLTWHELARQIELPGVTFTTVANWQRGVQTPTREQREALCRVLELDEEQARQVLEEGLQP